MPNTYINLKILCITSSNINLIPKTYIKLKSIYYEFCKSSIIPNTLINLNKLSYFYMKDINIFIPKNLPKLKYYTFNCDKKYIY